MSERVPEGWVIGNLGKEIDILSGFPFKSSEFTNDPSDIGLIRILDLLSQNRKHSTLVNIQLITLLRRGCLKDGDFHIVKWKSQNALLNQRIYKLVPKKKADLT